MRKICAATLCLAVLTVFVFSGCSLKKSAAPDPTETVVSIGDQKASLAVFKALYDTYLPYMQYYGQDPLESASSLETFQDWILDSLTGDIVTRHQADTAGFTLTPEQEAECGAKTEEELNDLHDQLMSYAEQSYSDDPSIPVDAYFESLVNSESEYYTGVSMSWEDYKAYYTAEARDAYIVTAYKDHVCREFVPSESDIRSWYETALENDKANYTDSPEKYKADEELYEMNRGSGEETYPITYVPAGYCRVMHIVVTPQGDLPKEYSDKLKRMEEIKTEYADLAFEDALNGTDANSAAIAALINEYMGLKEESDSAFDTYVEEARNKIYMAYGELESGKAFEDVMLRYTEDERVVGSDSSEGCEAFREKGELISLTHEGLEDWSSVVKAEFSKLVKGRYSGVFMDEGSYHIIYYASDEPAGEVPLELIHDDVEAICTEGVQNAQWDLIIEEWKKDPALKVNMDLIRQVGLEDLNKEDE